MAQIDLIVELKKGPAYDNAVICTYQFDAEFFEQYALRQCRAFAHCRSITIMTDEANYQTICTEQELKYVNRDYLLQGITVPGKFHPKLILLASAQRGKLIVGSANFTKPGLMHNAEMVQIYTYDEEHSETRAIFIQAFKMLIELAMEYPDTTLYSNIVELERVAHWLTVPDGRTGSDEFVCNTKVNLLDQVYDAIGDEPVEEYTVLSPFFDTQLAVLSAIANRLKPVLITIITQNQSTTLPVDQIDPWRAKYPGIALNIKLLRFQDDQEKRTLHAKLHLFRTEQNCVLLSGSANCTAAAMLKTAQEGNVECGILSKTAKARDAERLIREFAKLEMVTNLESIQRRPSDPQPTAEHFPIHLQEVRYENKDVLIVTAISNVPLAPDYVLLEICVDSIFRIPIGEFGKCISLHISVELQKALEDGSARARIINTQDKGMSNWRWVENIQEDALPVRLARDWRDSNEDADKFYSVLKALTARDDIEGLIDFLNWCNIPLEGFVSKPRIPVREIPEPGQIGWQMRERLTDILEALWHFYEIHLKKLQKHVYEPDRNRLPNFLHIYKTVTLALRHCWTMQVQNLTADGLVIPLEKWHKFRDAAGTILTCYRDILELLQRYPIFPSGLAVPGYADNTALLEKLLLDIQAIHSEWLSEAQRELVEIYQNYWTQNTVGMRINLPRDAHDDIALENWGGFRRELDKMLERAMK